MNERRYRLLAKNNRFSSLILILLLSVASIRRKLFKTTYSEERSVHEIQKVSIYDSDRKKKINFKEIIQILKPIVIDYFSTHSYKIVNISYFIYFLRN